MITTGWADSSLYHRVRHAVELLVRAKGKYAKRSWAAVQLILPISPHQLPENLRPHPATLTALANKSVTYPDALYFSGIHKMSAKDRDDLTTAVLALYEAVVKAR